MLFFLMFKPDGEYYKVRIYFVCPVELTLVLFILTCEAVDETLIDTFHYPQTFQD